MRNQKLLSLIFASCFLLLASFLFAQESSEVKPPEEAKDYKKIGEGDTGPNTGGMGAISPVPFATNDFIKKIEEQIIIPTVTGLQKENIEYKGFLYLKYEFRELGEASDKGVFYGYASLVDYFDNETRRPHYLWFASDFSGTQKMFVGNWRSNKSNVTKKCIFSHSICCVSELPYSSDFYYYPVDKTNEGEFPRIKPEFQNPEWDSFLKPSWAKEQKLP